MRVRIWPVLSSALLLSGCGTKSIGEDLRACEISGLAEFELPQALTGLELRASCDQDGVAAPVRVIGDSCSANTCTAAVAEIDAQGAGWSRTGQVTCVDYLIGMKDGSVAGAATTDAELVQLLGAIDTSAEAQLVAELKGLGCVRAGEQGGRLLVLGSEMLAICPIETRDVLYRIDEDASVHVLETGETVEESGCIGRRPAGLAQRGRVPSGPEIGDFLARSAELEAVSIVSFRILERELRAHGAPERLRSRTRQAAADELLHARLVQRLAEHFGGQVTRRTVRVAPVRDLETVALENSVEGCVAETWGCLVGMHQAQHAKMPLLRRAYQRIAADEARHAQLSWDIAAWAEQRLDRCAVERIRSRRAQAVRELAESISRETEQAAVREGLGLPDAASRRRLFGYLNDALWS